MKIETAFRYLDSIKSLDDVEKHILLVWIKNRCRFMTLEEFVELGFDRGKVFNLTMHLKEILDFKLVNDNLLHAYRLKTDRPWLLTPFMIDILKCYEEDESHYWWRDAIYSYTSEDRHFVRNDTHRSLKDLLAEDLNRDNVIKIFESKVLSRLSTISQHEEEMILVKNMLKYF